jgi:hypothetical protein
MFVVFLCLFLCSWLHRRLTKWLRYVRPDRPARLQGTPLRTTERRNCLYLYSGSLIVAELSFMFIDLFIDRRLQVDKTGI